MADTPSHPAGTQQSRGLKVILDSAMFFSSQVAARALNFFYFMVLAWSLPTDEFGILNYAISIVVMIDIVIDLGLSRHAMREMSKHPEQTSAYIMRLIPYKIAISLLTLAALWVWVTASGQAGDYTLILLFTSLGLLFSAPSMMLENVLQAHHKFAVISAAHMALSVVQFAVGGAILWFGGSTIAIAMTFTLTYLVYSSFMVWGVVSVGVTWQWRPDFSALLRSLPAAFPYLCSALIVLLAVRAEFLVLGLYGTAIDLGTFGIAAKIVEAALLLPLALATVMAPRFSKAHSIGPQPLSALYFSGLEVLLLLAFPAAIVTYALAPVLPMLLSDRAFGDLQSVVRHLFVGYPAACVFLFNTAILFGAQKQRYPLILLLSLAATQLAINFVLQSHYGLSGAVLSFGLFMATAALVSSTFILVAYAKGPGLSKALAAPGLAALVSLPVLLLAPVEYETVAIIGGLVIYMLTAGLVRKLLPGGANKLQLSV